MCICCKPSSRFLKNCLICQDMWAKKLHRIPQDESPVQEWLKLPNVTSYRGSMPAGLLTVLRMRYKIQDARWCVWQVVEVPGCLTEYYSAFDNSRETAGDVLYRLGIYPECSNCDFTARQMPLLVGETVIQSVCFRGNLMTFHGSKCPLQMLQDAYDTSDWIPNSPSC